MEATRIETVMASIRQRISGRSLGPGAKLPSVRGLAKSMQVSVSTVVEAYDRLVAEGVIRARPGSGYYVAGQAAALTLSDVGPKLDRAVDPLWVSRQSLEARGDTLKPGCGWLPPEWMPQEAIRRALRGLSRADDMALSDYGAPLGQPQLRQLIGRRLSAYGVDAPPDRIVLTESGTQAIDLVCRMLLEPGDTVLIDDPCYFNFQALLRAHRVKVAGVAYTENGPDLPAFEAMLAEHRPRLYITNSAIHNPTGAVLSPVVAHRLLKLAEQYQLTIVEDDIFADFEFLPAPRLAAFDGLERVIQIGSFSKTLSASARCGFIATNSERLEGLVDLKIATSFGGGRMTGELVHAILSDSGYRKHIDALRGRLAEARGEVSERLRHLGITPVIEPQAGMFLWCRLPDGIDSSDLSVRALGEDIILAPGNAFSLAQTAGSFLRFNASQSRDPRLFEALERLMEE